MGKIPDAGPGRPTGSTFYKITASGKAVAAWEQLDSRTRHFADLLYLLHTSTHGITESQLRQFMPMQPLMRAIASLTALGLIEPAEAHERALQQAAAMRHGVRSN
jgi:hypothetical protein